MHSSRVYFLLLLLLALPTGVLRAQMIMADRDSGIAVLDTLLSSVGQHPSLISERAALAAARKRISAKSSLMNPMLMLGIQNLPTSSFSFHDEMMTSKMIGLSQAVPFPGKLAAEEAIAAQDTQSTGFTLLAQKNSLRRDIKLAYFDLYHLDRATQTDQHHLLSLDELILAAQAKLTVGKITQQEILNLELERASIEDDIVQLRTEIAMRRSDLEALSGSLDSVPMTEQLAMPPLVYTLLELDSIAMLDSPILSNLRSQITQSELMVSRSILDKYPDFEFSLSYMQRDALFIDAQTTMKQSNMISASVSFDLPINYNSKRADATGEAEAMRDMRMADVRTATLDIHTQLQIDLAKLGGLRARYALLRNEIYPTILASLQTVSANYSYGKASLEEVLRTELSVLHREHDRYQIESDYNSTLAQIEYLVGKDLVRYSKLNDWQPPVMHSVH